MGPAGMTLSLRSYGERMLTHTHDFDQIVLPVTGWLDSRVGTKSGVLSPQCLAVIARGTPHSSRASGPNRFVILDVRSPTVMPGPTYRALDGRLSVLVQYADAELAAGRLAADTAFHLAALLVCRISQDDSVPTETPVARALSVMAARYGDNLTVADLADAAGMSAGQFHATFRRETGKTPAEMLRDIRLDKASAMLRGTDCGIADIALMVGFSDQTALTRCFRRFRATTPNALRQNLA